ncbi:hypothetical protein QBZ16_003922 [Prototheca wickerhamii]|uniref:Thioredoxin domain-containing protein n=1 Tax=Prototheca wickerhamii TaxID=3111 RepID=A0AAD9IJ23_PROWI|nr:hypothetical protein QBZ16_003922 [Prototheca wickerhamii]
MVRALPDELAAEYGDRLHIRKLNTDESPRIATEHGIQSIPTLMLFKQGKRVESVIGAVPKGTLKQVIDRHL